MVSSRIASRPIGRRVSGRRASARSACRSSPTRPSRATWPRSCNRTATSPASRSGRRTCCSTAACSRPTRCASGCWTCWASGSAAQSRRGCSKASTIWTTPSPAARPTTAGPSSSGGMRIRGGTARAYYVGIETAGLAVPGAPRPLRALCVAPIGMEEGTETDVPSGEIGLVVGEPAHFRFFSSSVRKADRPGDLLSDLDARRTARDRFAGSRSAARRIDRRALRAGPLPHEAHRAWRVGAMVRQHDERQAVEAGVQREGD